MTDEVPDYHPCYVDLEFGDGEHRFQLKLKQIAELQTLCKAGIAEIRARLLSDNWFAEDCIEAVRLGLIGGGMEGPAAKKMIANYCDLWPLEKWHSHAMAIVLACVHGYLPPNPPPSSEDEKKT